MKNPKEGNAEEIFNEESRGERERRKNPIPDYEHFFDDSEDEGERKGLSFTFKLLRKYWLKVLISQIMFIIKHSPVWLIPIATSEVVTIVTEANNRENAVRDIIIWVIVLGVMILQNIPTHIWYEKYTNKVLRNIGAGLRCSLIRKLQHLSVT